MYQRVVYAARGWLRTEPSIAHHVTNEDFVLLNNQLQKLELPLEYINRPFFIKVLSYGQTLSQIEPQEFIYLANRLRPYSPVHISILLKGSY
jgi:hypothetical protein